MGCHSIAVGRHVLTPADKDLLFLLPISVSADLGLLKWGQMKWPDKLLKERGRTIDLTDKKIMAELDSYVPAIQHGKGAAQLLRAG